MVTPQSIKTILSREVLRALINALHAEPLRVWSGTPDKIDFCRTVSFPFDAGDALGVVAERYIEPTISVLVADIKRDVGTSGAVIFAWPEKSDDYGNYEMFGGVALKLRTCGDVATFSVSYSVPNRT